MGAPIVHGIHGVLWGLDAFYRTEEANSPLGIDVNFLEPIYVGESATVTLCRRSDSEARLNIHAGGALATTIILKFGAARKYPPVVSIGPAENAPWPRIPVERDLQDMEGQSGAPAIGVRLDDVASAFPALCRAIPARRVASMIALSPLVGMISPGLHSLLKSYLLAFSEDHGEDVLRFATLDVNRRFRLVRMAVSAPGIAGECVAYARMPPVRQPSFVEIAARVSKSAYRGTRALVIGGSRGLGEVTAKACAAGGADVLITYVLGKGDAERVVEEIANAGGLAAARPFDIRGDVSAQLSNLGFAPTHIYYFPFCSRLNRHGSLSSTDLLAEYMRYYADGFFSTCQFLLGQAAGAEVRIFYPSTLSVVSPARGLAELAMAKAAGETLCRYMNQYLPSAHVLCHRLPRVLTDQTATVSPAESSSILEVMLPIVHEIQAPGCPVDGLELASAAQLSAAQDYV